jgi:ADP-ribosylglycohydrolase
MHALLPALRDGGDWRWLSERLFPGGSYGNGSAMRVAPLGAYFRDAPAGQVVAEAERSAEVTHAHPEAKAGAVATALAVWVAGRSRDGRLSDPAEWWKALLAPLDPSLRVTRGLRRAESLSPDASLSEAVARLGNGSHVTCADTVPLALWIAMRHLDDFETAVRHALAAGGDTDTVAAIVGGIVAARVGPRGLPPQWVAAVEPLPIE